ALRGLPPACAGPANRGERMVRPEDPPPPLRAVVPPRRRRTRGAARADPLDPPRPGRPARPGRELGPRPSDRALGELAARAAPGDLRPPRHPLTAHGDRTGGGGVGGVVRPARRPAAAGPIRAAG